MRKLMQLVLLVTWMTLALVAIDESFGLNEPSHEVINGQAAKRSTLDGVLKEQLGMSAGVDTILRGRNEINSVLRWIELGGRREDDSTYLEYLIGKSRSYRHFHDPLVNPWSLAGLRFPPFPRFESSVRWAERTDQDSQAGFGNYSWRDARR